MSETKREYANNYRKPAAAHPLQEGPIRQPSRPAEERPAGASGRRAQRAGLRHDERKAAQDHQARGDRHPDGERIRQRQFARDQDADRHDEGHRKKDLRRTAAGAAPVRPGGRGGDQRRRGPDPGSPAARNPGHERGEPGSRDDLAASCVRRSACWSGNPAGRRCGLTGRGGFGASPARRRLAPFFGGREEWRRSRAAGVPSEATATPLCCFLTRPIAETPTSCTLTRMAIW